jgi:hypothetical protein
MHVRKIAAAAMFATGAAVALSPLAQADLTSTVSSTLASEIALQNTIFEAQAATAGADVTPGVNGGYDTLTNLVQDAPKLFLGGTPGIPVGEGATFGQVTPLETEIYGANPIVAGIGSATGPFNEYNGALTEFYDAYNVYAYAAANNGALDTNVGDYLGSTTTIGHAISGEGATVTSAAEYFYNFGLGDLKGFEGNFAPTASGPGDILPTEYSEITQLNSLFELDGKLANVFGDIAPNAAPGTNVGFDTIDPTKLTSAFDSLVFGASAPSTDPGAYDVFNGALTEFFNADNVGLYALLNGGDLLPGADVFGGAPADWATETVSGAISTFLQDGFNDIAGYFIPAAASAIIP